MIRKLGVAAVVCTAVLLGSAVAASAGEWNPKRGYIHVDEHGDQVGNPGRSACSYSGRDDPDPEDDELWGASPAKGRVQSPGQLVALFGPEAAGIPGQACRGNVPHEE